MLRAFSGGTVAELSAGLLADPARHRERESRVPPLLALPAQSPLLLKVREEDATTGRRWAAWEVARGLGELTAALVRAARPRALFCCGGDTASAVMEEVGAWGSELLREVVPGMVLGLLRGGVLDGIPLVTKPGSFGTDEDLVELHRYLTAQRKGHTPS